MTIWIAFGWFGFGATGGQFPELRVGLIAVGCSWGPHHRNDARWAL